MIISNYASIINPLDPKTPRKANAPLGYSVCWRCRDGHKTLFRIRDAQGKKTQDYVCSDCRAYGKPPIGNVSFVKYE